MPRGRCALSITFMALLCHSSVTAPRADEIPFTVLPSTQAPQPERLCSRSGPGHISSGWDPTTSQIRQAEALLPAFVESLGRAVPRLERRVPQPDESYRQYIGVVIGGRQLIYVNVFPRRPSTGWRTHFVHVRDGGAAFWGVLFDPQARRFFSPQFNGTI